MEKTPNHDQVEQKIQYEVDLSGLLFEDEVAGSPEVQATLVMLYNLNLDMQTINHNMSRL